MMQRQLALMGGTPIFEQMLPTGQRYRPSRQRFEGAFRGIFDREYYNNNGPLSRDLENRLAEFLGVKHVIGTSNTMMALMILGDALELSGSVIVPAFAHINTAHALLWVGLRPIFCDVDLATAHLSPIEVERYLEQDTIGILGANIWGGACDIAGLTETAAKHNLSLFFDSSQAFGCTYQFQVLGGFGDAEVLSFHPNMVINGADSGAIATNRDDLAERARSIRPSYGSQDPVEVLRVANARLSEAQGALALIALDEFEQHRERNRVLFDHYREGLAAIPGLCLQNPTEVTDSNYQSVTCVIEPSTYGISRDGLLSVLEAENIQPHTGLSPTNLNLLSKQRSIDELTERYPNSLAYASSTVRLPIGQAVSLANVSQICDLLRYVHVRAQSTSELDGL